jgi:hypothetical protein
VMLPTSAISSHWIEIISNSSLREIMNRCRQINSLLFSFVNQLFINQVMRRFFYLSECRSCLMVLDCLHFYVFVPSK